MNLKPQAVSVYLPILVASVMCCGTIHGRSQKTWTPKRNNTRVAGNVQNMNQREKDDVILDNSVPMSVRMKGAKKWHLKESTVVKLLTTAVDKDNPSRATKYEDLVRAYFSPDNNEHVINRGANTIICNYNNLNVPLEARKLAFSCIQDEEDICSVLMSIATIKRDENESSLKADDLELVKYVLEKTDRKLIEKFLLDLEKYMFNKRVMLPFLMEASKYISDESILVKIAEQKSIRRDVPKFARELVKRVEGAQFKKNCNDVLAECGESVKERAEALVGLYSVDPARAYEIVTSWILTDEENKCIMAIEDMNTLIGLVKYAKNDKTGSDSWIAKNIRKTKAGVLNCIKLQVEALTPEALAKLVETVKAKGDELLKSGKVCVVGNYWVNMPAQWFVALAKTQDTKAAPLDWEWDDENKQVVMTEIAFNSKNLYKATGLEKTEVKFGLTSKLGVARFEVGMTEIQYNRNLFAESMGSYDFNTVSGGDIYYKSESQAKGVVLLFWEKSGQLVMSRLE